MRHVYCPKAQARRERQALRARMTSAPASRPPLALGPITATGLVLATFAGVFQILTLAFGV